MTSEHTHKWITSDPQEEPVCAICREGIIDVAEQLEQQLAQAREELRLTRLALETTPPRMVIETKGEAQGLVAVLTREKQELEQQLEQARRNEAAWEQVHQQGMADLRQMALRKHRQYMNARALLEELASMDYRLAKLADLIELQEKTRTLLTEHPQEAPDGA